MYVHFFRQTRNVPLTPLCDRSGLHLGLERTGTRGRRLHRQPAGLGVFGGLQLELRLFPALLVFLLPGFLFLTLEFLLETLGLLGLALIE